MIRSEIAHDAPAAAVTFTLAHSGLDGHRVAVVGDFNGWDPGATPMDREDGAYTATVTLAPGRYRFRYLSEDGAWFNDDAADDYEPNEYGGQDSVLDLTVTTLTEADLRHHDADPPAGLNPPGDPGAPDTAADFPRAEDLAGGSDAADEADGSTGRGRVGESRRERRARKSLVGVELAP
jgi:hypothetical protein